MDRVRRYYSKLQERFVDRDEYFDEILFGTLEAPFDKQIRNNNDNNIKEL